MVMDTPVTGILAYTIFSCVPVYPLIYPSPPPFSSPNYGERHGGHLPRLIVVHYTAISCFEVSKEYLCDVKREVSAHWLVDRCGYAEALVGEEFRAWHAGVGSWGGCNDVNSISVGIELVNSGAEPFPEPQMKTLEKLISNIMERWSIPSWGVIGHCDLAPDRKIDPGAHFDWRRLALGGLSVWPDLPETREMQNVDPVLFASLLHRFGYPEVSDERLLRAFRLRFRPWVEGELDQVDMALAADLAKRFPVDLFPS